SKAFFSQEMIPLTEVTVVPGEVSFAGEYRILTDLDIKNADPAQAHYLQIIAGSAAGKGQFARSLSGQGLYRAKLESATKKPADEREFWEEAKGDAFRSQGKWLRLV